MPRSLPASFARVLANLALWVLIAVVLAQLHGWYLRPYGPFMNLLLLGVPAVVAGAGAVTWRGGWQAAWVASVAVAACWIPGLLSSGGRAAMPTARQGAQILILGLVLLALLGCLRRLLERREATGPAEEFRHVGMLGAVVWLFRPFLTPFFFGGIDAQSYAYGLADALTQARAGVFPVLVGQSEFMFEGVIHPLRTAPYHHYLGILLDFATARSLEVPAVQHLIVVASGAAAALVCYWCLRSLVPARPWTAWALALMYVSSPAFLGFNYALEMYMTVTAFAWVPVVLLANIRLYRADENGSWALLGSGLALVWYCHAPVGLWLTICTGCIQVWRLAHAAAKAWGRALAGLLLFLALGAGYFWSVVEIVAAPGSPGGGRELSAACFLVAGLVGWVRFLGTRRPVWLVPIVLAAGLAAWDMPSLGWWLGLAAIFGAVLAWTTPGTDWAGRPGVVMALAVGTGLVALWIHPAAEAIPTLEALRSLWPADLAPVSATTNRLGDVQPGLGLLLAGAVGAAVGYGTSRIESRVAALVLLVFLALYFPIPGLTRLILAHVPEPVTSVSSISLWQRSLPILTALLALVGMMGLGAWSERNRRGAKIVTGLLLVALAWSFAEAEKYVRSGYARVASTGEHFDFRRPENIRNFAYVFPRMPRSRYVVNGVADYHLESRLLSPAETERPAVEPFSWEGVAWRRLVATVEPDNPAIYRVASGFTLAPGEYKAVCFRFLTGGDYEGTLIMRGSGGWYREYQFPEAGFGELSFGVAAGRPKVLALWNTGTQIQRIELQFIRAADKPGVVPPPDFADVAEQSYDPSKLPVRTESLVPYRATAVLVQEAWLETPRAYIPGYWAKVNGRGVTVVESVNHRAMVKLGPGENHVVMTYPGTVGLVVAWTVSAACWAGLLGWGAWQRFQGLRKEIA